MYIRICIYIHIYACVYVCMCVCACVRVRVRACVPVCLCAYVRVCTYRSEDFHFDSPSWTLDTFAVHQVKFNIDYLLEKLLL